MLKDFPELIKCIEGGNINAVKNAVEIGNTLHIIKGSVKDKKESWLDFMRDNFSVSIRLCQDYMKLSKTPIHKNHYKLGVADVLTAIRAGYDLSNSYLDQFVCSECGCGPWDGCQCPLFKEET
jgi:hypothetical protein